MFEQVEGKVRENKHDVVNRFLRYKASTGNADSTILTYSQYLYYFFHDYYPDLDPRDVEIHHIEEYLQRLEQNYNAEKSVNSSMTNSTKQSYLTALSSFYQWAMKRPTYEDINGNPAGVVIEEIPEERRDRPEVASWENAKKIVQEITDPRDQLAVGFMAKTGARIGETMGIETSDLMLDQGFVLLRDRKGGKRTYVPIDDELIFLFKRYLKMRKYPDMDPVFVSRTGRPLTRQGITPRIREAAVETGVMEPEAQSFHKRFSPHTFRTVFTTLMRKQGMEDHHLKYIRGDSLHSDILDHYTKIDKEEVRQEYLACIKPLEII